MTSLQNNADNFGNDERLSALLDDELSLADRTEFEKQLSESPELRQRLDELRKTSVLVKSLPKQAAPDELKSAVMRAVERETLLAPASGSQSGDGPRRNSVVVKLVSAAALIAVAVVLWINRDPQQEQFVKQDEIKTDSQSVAPEHANEQQARVDDAVPREAVTAKGMLLEKDQLTAANIGDFVKGLVRKGNSVAIVRLRVIDRQESIEALELVLSPENRGTGASEDGLVAVYIESGPEKLSEAIAQMGKSLNRMELTSRIQISELDSDFVDSMKEYRGKLDQAPLISRMPVESVSKIDELVKKARASTTDVADAAASDSRVRVIFLLNGVPKLSDGSL